MSQESASARVVGSRRLIQLATLLLPTRWLSPHAASFLPPVLWLQQVPHLVWLVTLPMALIAWRLRARWSACLLLLLTAFLIAPIVSRPSAESGSPSTSEPSALRIVTWNVANDLVERDQFLTFLEECDAHVVALQELSLGKAEWLQSIALELYPHRSLHGLGKGGLAVLSRYPLLNDELFYLHGDWPHLRATVQSPAREVTVFVSHPRAWLALLGAWQPAYHDFATLGELATHRAPSVLVGDLNATERTGPYHVLCEAGLLDAFRTHSNARGFTFPVWRRFHGIPSPPIARIDYIFHTPDLSTTHCWLGEDGGSDHLPLFAEFDSL